MKNAAHPPPEARDGSGRVSFFPAGHARFPTWLTLGLLLTLCLGQRSYLGTASAKEKKSEKAATAQGALAPPTCSHSSGIYQTPFELSLRTSLGDASIQFTTDGSEPSVSHGTRYAQPIMVSRSTILRTLVLPASGAPSEIINRTFLFPADLLHQTGEGFPGFWGVRDRDPVRAHYPLNGAILQEAGGSNAVAQAIQSLPVMSIQADVRDLFDGEKGIYANPMLNGAGWERPRIGRAAEHRK